MRRFTVLGFTEAELGFVLAATFAAFGVASTTDNSSSTDALTRADSTVRAERYLRDSVEATLRALRDSVRRKSNLTPPCYEKGESRAPIAELTIVGGNRYAVNADTISFAEVERRLAIPIARSAALACRFTVVARATTGVDAPLHAAAMARLRSKFYVDGRQR